VGGLGHRGHQFARQVHQVGPCRDQASLEFDALRVAIVFGAGHAPAAPVGLVGDHHRVTAGVGMVDAVGGVLPLVARAQDAPVAYGAGGGIVRGNLQFRCGELAAQAHVVGDPDRLVETLGPDGHDLFDLGPDADALDPDLLALLELGARHSGLP